MYQKNSAVGSLICLGVFFLFGFIFFLRPFSSFYFIPIFPLIFIIIIGVIAVSVASAKSNRVKNLYHQKIPIKNPYLAENIKQIPIQGEKPQKFEKEIKEVNPLYCQYCGTKIDEDAFYCHSCGSRLNEF